LLLRANKYSLHLFGYPNSGKRQQQGGCTTDRRCFSSAWLR
ncbi:jg22711, partial [Pararge aegeria aegeria]